YFGEPLAEPCGNCDTCLEPVETWDATEAAQQALSCVYRTGQRFGVGHVVDVLRGEDGDRVRSLGHQRLSTYGIGRDRDAKAWRSVFRQLVARGLLTVDLEGFGTLRLTEACRPVLRGEERLRLRVDPSPRRPERRATRPRPGAPPGGALWEALRQRRRELAEAQGVPPYVIFHDSTLAEMAEQRPTTLDALAGITGVGATKLERYGEAFLAVIREQAQGAGE
ncbi:MAG: HRDC domain-containing protein, partial [Gammaproteobacteria bacterium]|nr:HRDC domain-containing protein [Gammaproteobacteria bacterium]